MKNDAHLIPRRARPWRAPLVLLACLLAAGAGRAPAEPPAAPAPADQMAYLRERQDLIVEATAKNLTQMQMTFAIVGGIFSFLTIMMVLRQFHEQSRRNRIEEQNMNEVKGVMNSFKDNINTINSLIVMLKGSFEFQEKVAGTLEKLDQRIGTLDAAQKQEEVAFLAKLDALNTLASETFKKCDLHRRDREAFKREENKIALQSVASFLTTLERVGNVKGRASPVAFFLRALGRFNGMEYEDDVGDLDEARGAARAQIDSPLRQYGRWDADEAKSALRLLLDECCYHLGIMYYNLGKYDEARKEFDASFERNPSDFRSRIYVPELLFFDERNDPRRVKEEYEAALTALNNVPAADRARMAPPWNAHYAALKMRQGNFYLPKPVRPARRGAWEKYENAETARDCYWEGKKASDSPFVNFSLAQALVHFKPGPAWKDTSPEELFRKAFNSFRGDAVLKTEPILLTTLYYCAAVSCFHARVHGESPSLYLMQARQHLQRVPGGIRVFSPVNKINMSHQDLFEEMNQLEHWWQSQ